VIEAGLSRGLSKPDITGIIDILDKKWFLTPEAINGVDIATWEGWGIPAGFLFDIRSKLDTQTPPSPEPEFTPWTGGRRSSPTNVVKDYPEAFEGLQIINSSRCRITALPAFPSPATPPTPAEQRYEPKRAKTTLSQPLKKQPCVLLLELCHHRNKSSRGRPMKWDFNQIAPSPTKPLTTFEARVTVHLGTESHGPYKGDACLTKQEAKDSAALVAYLHLTGRCPSSSPSKSSCNTNETKKAFGHDGSDSILQKINVRLGIAFASKILPGRKLPEWEMETSQSTPPRFKATAYIYPISQRVTGDFACSAAGAKHSTAKRIMECMDKLGV